MDRALTQLVADLRCGHPTVDFAADLILEGEIRPVLLDAAAFEKLALTQFGLAPADVATTFGLKRPYSSEFYLRLTSPHLASDAVHEAAHWMDEQDNVFSPKALEVAFLTGALTAGHIDVSRCVRWVHEVRAFLLEREFQLARYPGISGWPQFTDANAISEFVQRYYAAVPPSNLPPEYLDW
jgi:hypothetical protein